MQEWILKRHEFKRGSWIGTPFFKYHMRLMYIMLIACSIPVEYGSLKMFLLLKSFGFVYHARTPFIASTMRLFSWSLFYDRIAIFEWCLVRHEC